MKIVGLTGGIGSGKSLVATMFKGFGIAVYDSDLEAKYLMNTSVKLRKDIIALLGESAYDKGGLNRKYIAEKVFKDADLLSKLNGIVHPAVQHDFLQWVKRQESPYVIQETALIFENNAADRYDYVILVITPEEERVKRVMERDGQSREKVLARIKNQLDDQHKIPQADFVIKNLIKEDTHESVFQIHKAILAEMA
ncbi:MAG: dephospho-CoA kinase [Allomuricauda sp.]|nr:MAG: dephospho-CoA kinase [Allomuricauda sp.]